MKWNNILMIKALPFLIFTSVVSTGKCQMIPYQSVKIQYDGAGNRVIRKPYNPQEMENKKSDFNTPEQTSNSLHAFPNPTQDELYITWDVNDSITSIMVINIMGQVISRCDMIINQDYCQMDISDHPSGVYQIVAQGIKQQTLTIIKL